MSCYYRYNSGWSGSPRQNQDQVHVQAADSDQDQKNVFREIGNVHIDIDNTNILVAVLVVVAWLSGQLDGAGIEALLSRLMDRPAN